MPSEKLKRISLGVVAFLILTVLCWLLFLFGPIAYFIRMRNPASLMALAYGSFLAMALILVLGLYLIAKILIEIFK